MECTQAPAVSFFEVHAANGIDDMHPVSAAPSGKHGRCGRRLKKTGGTGFKRMKMAGGVGNRGTEHS